jgi:hypothetical protein
VGERGRNSQRRRSHKVSKSKVLKSQSQDGYGLCDFKTFRLLD